MASDYLLEIDGIKGESSALQGAIEIESFSWGVSNAGSHASGGGGGAGKASFSDLSFVSMSSSATPELKARCATGKHIPKAVLYARLGPPSEDPVGGASGPYLKIVLENIMVSSVRVAVGDVNGDGRPDLHAVSDRVTLNFKLNSFFDVVADLPAPP